MTHPFTEPDGSLPDEPPVDQDASAGAPRWVKLFLIGGAVLAILLVLAMVVSEGDHGPGRHGGGEETPSPSVDDDGGHTPIDHGP